MGEDSFFNALFQIMWNMEIDIFSERNKTLALLADVVPKCKKQRKRLEAMYDCGAMDLIERAVAERDQYELNLKKAVRTLVLELGISVDKSLFSVNQIIDLWDGDLEHIENYDENEDLDHVQEDESEDEEIIVKEDFEEEEFSDSTEEPQPEPQSQPQPEPQTEQQNEQQPEQQNEQDSSEPVSEEINESSNEKKDGEEEMIFLQDIAEGENNESKEEQPAEAPQEEAPAEEQPAEEPQPPRESLLKKIAQFWCKSDCEDGRPYMIACPVGWVLILLCSVLGAFMIYDIPLGDKFAAPTFAMMFSVLTAKRLYRYESAGRFSIVVGIFYLAAMFRVMWSGKGYPPINCVPLVAAALIVFNSGRIGTMLDETKKNSFLAYLIIIVFSAAVTVGAYAIQRV